MTSFTLTDPAHEELEHEEKICKGDRISQLIQLVDPNVHQNGLTAKGLSSLQVQAGSEFELPHLAVRFQ